MAATADGNPPLSYEIPQTTGTAVALPGIRPDALANGFGAWWAAQRRRNHHRVSRVRLADLPGWDTDPATGNLVHRSGRFFTIEGLAIDENPGRPSGWSQPIINQPEIGVLGIAVREFDGVPHCLLQSKMEPGNANLVQLSPTVQATQSNYKRVHGGDAVPYLDLFLEPGRAEVVVDLLQSELGSWCYRKRNRNMVVRVGGDVAMEPGFRWVPLADLFALLHVDNMVNMDTRTVLSGLPLPDRSGRVPRSRFAAGLVHSMSTDCPRHTTPSILSWLTSVKARRAPAIRPVPLDRVPGWGRDEMAIYHRRRTFFDVIGVTVRTPDREVASWSQPLVAPVAHGLCAFLVRPIRGVPHLLVQGRFEGGLLDMAELAPTVQSTPEGHRNPWDAEQPFLRYVRDVPAHRIRYDTLLSEEGGRFYHAVNRYLLVEVEDGFPLDEPDGYRWVTLGQLTSLAQRSYQVNIQARTLLAAAHSLWIGAM